jgi:hypothetical protein
MLDAACNFVHKTVYNAKYDITWSFQYSLCGVPGSTGGFTTFLYDANTDVPEGGGVRSGLGYGPCEVTDNLLISPSLTDRLAIATLNEVEFGGFIRISDGELSEELAQPGVNGAMIGVGFDPTGQFAVRQQGFLTGLDESVPNTYACRLGTDFLFISAYAAPFSILEQTEQYRTLRFNLTDVGQTLNVHVYDASKQTYNLISSIPTQLLFMNDKMCRIGISYASPVSAGYGAAFKLKHFHSHGRL